MDTMRRRRRRTEASVCGMLFGRRVHQGDVALRQAVALEGFEQQEVLDQTELDGDFLALEILDRINPRFADNHCRCFAVVDDRDKIARGAVAPHPRHHDDAIGVDLAGGKGVDGRP